MKKPLTLLFAAMAFCGCQKDIVEESLENLPATRTTADSSEHYYWLGDEKIPLRKMDNKFYVMYESSNEEKLKAELAKTGIELVNPKENRDHSRIADIKNFDAKTINVNVIRN